MKVLNLKLYIVGYFVCKDMWQYQDVDIYKGFVAVHYRFTTMGWILVHVYADKIAHNIQFYYC